MAIQVAQAVKASQIARRRPKYCHVPVEGQQTDQDEVVYLVAGLVQCGFPHSRQQTLVWTRSNRDCHLTLIGHPETGLPWGPLPRLILAHCIKHAKRYEQKKINLKNISSFMRSMGMQVTGGANGSINRVREQIEALLRTHIEIKLDGFKRYEIKNSSFFSKGQICVGNKDGYLEFSDDFYEAIHKSAVPFDLVVLRKLKTSPLALDIYFWASWRSYCMFSDKDSKTLVVSFDNFHGPKGQTGAFYSGYGENPAVKSRFVCAVKKVVKRINAGDDLLLLSVNNSGLLLKASPPRVRPREICG